MTTWCSILLFSLLSLAASDLGLAAESTPEAAAPVAATRPDAPLNYVTLTHKLAIDSLRAGSHDESGTNSYFFDVKMYALLNSPEERNAAFDARQKLVVELGAFGDTQIESLALWTPDEKLKNFKELKIDGNGLRELAARAMTEFKVPESSLAIMIEVVMYERAKKFIFFGDDTLVAKASYFPIPQTKFDKPLRANQSLSITDDKGTQVAVAVRYEPIAPAR